MKKEISACFDWVAGEWLLKVFGSNGGTVIALRAVWISIFFTALAMVSVSSFDPSRVCPISRSGIAEVFWAVSNTVVIFLGASYLALYARFVSQWGYLAGLYNLIKQTEATAGVDQKVIAQWKAGYLEDAENLHLAAKNNLAPVLHAWTKDAAVESEYIKSTPGGKKRFDKLSSLAKRAYDEETAKWTSL